MPAVTLHQKLLQVIVLGLWKNNCRVLGDFGSTVDLANQLLNLLFGYLRGFLAVLRGIRMAG